MCHLLDFHTTFGGSHEDDPAGRAIHYRPQIEFLGNTGTGFHQNTIDRLPLGIRLVGHQTLVNPLLGKGPDLVLAGSHFDTTSLTPTTSMYLAFYYPLILTQAGSCIYRFLGTEAGNTGRNRQPIFGKKLLCLIFMQIHDTQSLCVVPAPVAPVR